MTKIIKCVNGHQFDADKYKECPNCPKTTLSKGGASTKPITAGVTSAAVGNKTVPVGTAKTVLLTDTFPAETRVITDNKTHILQGTKIFRDGKESKERKLVGFLVSYDLHEQGKLFRLFEGKNLVGSDRSCDSIIENVPAVSGKHLTILYRNGMFLFKDEFSTNGTYIDGEMKNEGVLDQNCTITVGGVKLLFIMVPFDLLGE